MEERPTAIAGHGKIETIVHLETLGNMMTIARVTMIGNMTTVSGGGEMRMMIGIGIGIGIEDIGATGSFLVDRDHRGGMNGIAETEIMNGLGDIHKRK